ncbi:DUF3592 domain-containing protein [Nostoc sp. TCL26-01]|uniref:DUF3592 domain-containing protein n=1 Tax=Nostoc sp. TCL26-01 TaxID=2576904 RepID=UPI0015C08258|nr:DUF3592 domain-containing protein [Nostoc sp. TCL26-01]QLE58184.1 DUF3592 domain-containing protein [Nostoc sp. TCL26-01]
MDREEAKFLLMFGSIFAGVGSIFAVVGIIVGVNTHSFVSSSVKTSGTVIDLEGRWSNDSEGRSYKLYYPVIEFTNTSGQPTVFQSNAGSTSPGLSKGEQVEVLYNPQQPNSAMINSGFELWFLPGLFTAIGSVFVLIGGVPLVYAVPKLLRGNSKAIGNRQ